MFGLFKNKRLKERDAQIVKVMESADKFEATIRDMENITKEVLGENYVEYPPVHEIIEEAIRKDIYCY